MIPYLHTYLSSIRDINYDKFFNEGDLEIVKYEDYTSHNTRQLKINEIIELLMKVDVVKDSLNA